MNPGVLAALWAVLGEQAKELLAAIFRAAVSVNAALAVPESQPGWDRPELSVGAESTREQVERALIAFDELAERYRGLRLATLLSREQAPVAPTWLAVIERARSNAGAGMVAAIESLQGAITDWNANAGATTPALNDSHARSWLFMRLDRVSQQPEAPNGNGRAMLFIALALATALGRSRR